MNGNALDQEYTSELIDVINKMESDLESYKETLEILGNKELMEQIRESEEDIKAGRTGKILSKKDIGKLFE